MNWRRIGLWALIGYGCGLLGSFLISLQADGPAFFSLDTFLVWAPLCAVLLGVWTLIEERAKRRA